LHIFSQAFQNVTVKVRVDVVLGGRNSWLTVPYTLKKQWAFFCWTPNLPHLFCSWWVWALPLQWLLLCFCIITVNPTFVIRYDPRYENWVLGSRLSYLKTHIYAPLHLIIFLVKIWQTHNWSQWCLQAHGSVPKNLPAALIGDGLLGWVLEFVQHYVILQVLGHPERLSSSTDTQSAFFQQGSYSSKSLGTFQ
jgi:hypothetical protein